MFATLQTLQNETMFAKTQNAKTSCKVCKVANMVGIAIITMQTILITDVRLPRCGEKVVYPHKKDAQTVRNQVLRRRRKRPEVLRIYCCPYCDGWHLSSHR
jgi:hypothetical protein